MTTEDAGRADRAPSVVDAAEGSDHRVAVTLADVRPAERLELLIGAMHLVQWVHEVPLGLVIIGRHTDADYLESLQRFAHGLNVRAVQFIEHLPDDRAHSTLRSAAMVVSTGTSRRSRATWPDGSSIDLPIVAIGHRSDRESDTDAVLLLPESAGPELLSEAIAAVARETRPSPRTGRHA